MNIDYIGDVTLKTSCFDTIVQFSFRIADCGGELGNAVRNFSFKAVSENDVTKVMKKMKT